MPRRITTTLLICALVLVPLAKFDWVVPKAQAQARDCFNNSANYLFQRCPLGGVGVEQALEEQAINDALKFYKMPATQRSLLLSHGRNELRGFLFGRLMELIHKTNPTPNEQQALAHFANRIKQKRVAAATFALEEYLRWKEVPCFYGSPPPLEYDPSHSCYRNPLGNVLTGGPLPPSFEEFEQIGVLKAYEDANSVEAKAVAEATARNVLIFSSIEGTVPGDIQWQLVFDNTALTAAFLAIAGFATASTIAAASATVSVGLAGVLSGALGVGGFVAGIIFAIVVAVSRGIDVVNASQLQGKLETAKANAENATIDLRQIDDTELYGAFILSTLPDFSDSSVPPPTAFDRQFLVRDHNSTTTISSPTISYKDWEGNCHTARQSGAWFVDRDHNGVEKMTLSIYYLDWNSKERVATRHGQNFVPTLEGTLKLDLPNVTANLGGEILYLDCNQTRKVARIKFEQMTTIGNPLVTVGCPLDPNSPQSRVIGSVAGSGDLPASLEVTVNDQSSATVNGITVRDLAVNSQYQITANVFVPATTPATADFTVKVRNTIGQTSSASFTVRKTAIANPLPETIPDTVNLGASYYAQLRPDILFISCGQSNGTIAVTDGALPHGLSLQREGQFGLAITGTPTAGGAYPFTVTETISNGESQSRNYVIFVNSNLVELPSGVVSWWRGEGNADDFAKRHQGSLFGSARFARGFINTAFNFNGTNGYVALPNDTFEPSLDFSYELWFKTKNPGVILGRQRGVAPYNTPLQGTRAPIYVGSDGKLRVRMFGGDGETFISSPQRVDNNAFHHVAVTYNRAAQIQEVYLNGNLIGSISSLMQGNDPNFIYQLGTGYVSDSQLNMFGWFNFNGAIDEPTLYNRALTANEIRSIYTAGGAGKISVQPIAIPPSTHNGADGGIAILAQGGLPPLLFSKDNGATFQESNSFYDLSPGDYAVVIKDATNRKITKTVSIPNPPPTITLAATASNPTCTFSQTGRITLYATGTSGPAQYSVLNGANAQSSNVFEGLSAGTYTPWVRDPSGTVVTGDPIFLTNPPQLSLSPHTVPEAMLGQYYAQTFTSNGGTGARRMTAINLPPGLTATSTASGVTISGTPTEVGNFFAFVKVEDANDCLAARNVNIKVVAASCNNVTLMPNAPSFAASGGTGTINITVPSGCSWSATNNSPGLLSLTSTASGNGNGTLSYTVAAHTNQTPRSGTITINGLVYTVYQGAQFNDVPVGHIFYDFIGKLSARGITLGCGGGNYCPDANVSREQMAPLVIRSLGVFNPPPPTMQRFTDVPSTNIFYTFIEELAVRQITLGCGGGNYCPTAFVTREQMAAFLIRALHPPGYVPPPPATQRFLDVPQSNIFYAHIEELAVRGITLGCGGGNYCPAAFATRAQMAAFLVRAFNL